MGTDLAKLNNYLLIEESRINRLKLLERAAVTPRGRRRGRPGKKYISALVLTHQHSIHAQQNFLKNHTVFLVIVPLIRISKVDMLLQIIYY